MKSDVPRPRQAALMVSPRKRITQKQRTSDLLSSADDALYQPWLAHVFDDRFLATTCDAQATIGKFEARAGLRPLRKALRDYARAGCIQ